MYSDDGMVFRLPESDQPPEPELFFPAPDEIEDVVTESLGGTSLFAARFRENAARALLLPRRHPGRRSPLWAQRKRSSDLLAVASRYGSFPILLETYRECLRDVFDLPALIGLMADVRARRIRVASVDTPSPSPFASSLAFSYVARFLYEGDAPLADRRAVVVRIAGEDRLIAAEDAARYRDGLGVVIPPGLPEVFLAAVPDALVQLVRRWARCHGPFLSREPADRFGLPEGVVEPILDA